MSRIGASTPRGTAIFLGMALVSGAVLGTPGTARAANVVASASAVGSGSSPTPYSDPSVSGGLTFQDSNMKPLTTGQIDADPTFPFVAGDRPAPNPQDDLTRLEVCTPVEGVAAADWNCDPLNDTEPFATGATPVNTGKAGAGDTLGSYIAQGDEARNPADPSSAYYGLYQIRLITLAAGGQVDRSYYASTIQVTEGPAADNGDATGTWQVVTGGGSVATTLLLAVSPAGASQQTGTTITLTATLTPSTAVGTLAFADGGQAIPVQPGATTVQLTPTSGPHTFTATFTPTDAAAYQASAASTPRVLFGDLKQACVTLSVAPAGAVPLGADITLTATVSTAPSGGNCTSGQNGPALPGSVDFDQAVSGNLVRLGSGAGYSPSTPTATFTVVAPPAGAYPFVARFIPADTDYDLVGISPVLTTEVGQVNLAITGSRASPVPTGSMLTLTGTVTPPVAGVLSFYTRPAGAGSGNKPIADAMNYNPTTGVGSVTIQTPLMQGSLAYGATFVPTNAAGFTTLTSTQNPIAYTFVQVAPTVSLTLDNSQVVAGSTQHLSIQVSPPGIAGRVEIFDGAVDLGAADSYDVGQGLAAKALSLGVGEHSLSAQFTPADTSQFGIAFSAGLTTAVTATPVPPILVAPPVAEGTAHVGHYGTCQSGAWLGQNTYHYQWLRDGVPIRGATATKYSFVAADLGHVLSCAVSATNANGVTTARSAGLRIGLGQSPYPTRTIHLKGTPLNGKHLGTTVLKWSAGPIRVTYQWLRDGHVIRGAHHATYLTSTKDVHHKISVRLTGAIPGSAAKVISVPGARIS